MRNTKKIGGLRVWRRGDTGLFACAGGSPAPEDVRAAVSYWKGAGCRRAFGPVCARAADVGGGICVWRNGEEPELLGARGPGDDSALLEAGFAPAGEEYAFRFPLPDMPKRAGMEVRRGVTARDCAKVMGADVRQARRALLALMPWLRGKYCFTAWKDGPKGVLIALSRGKRLRILTLWAVEDFRNGAACVPLLRALIEAARANGIPYIDAARVPADNPHSLRLARALGGREIARYRLYSLELK